MQCSRACTHVRAEMPLNDAGMLPESWLYVKSRDLNTRRRTVAHKHSDSSRLFRRQSHTKQQSHHAYSGWSVECDTPPPRRSTQGMHTQTHCRAVIRLLSVDGMLPDSWLVFNANDLRPINSSKSHNVHIDGFTDRQRERERERERGREERGSEGGRAREGGRKEDKAGTQR
jgi:hypothetical protein